MKLKIDIDEHSDIECSFDDETIKEFNKYFKDKDLKYLGLHQEFDGSEVKLKSHYYIGYRWLNNDEYIHVAPKKYNEYHADYLKMFLECLKNPIVSKHLDETYKIFFDEKWIEKEDEKDEITPLIILHFLKVIEKITQKGLKKGYIKVTENLTSKTKGKILINQTIKQNHFKNRLDKTVCNHQIYTTNCIENQILKTALMQCGRNLHGVNSDDISKLLRKDINAFELVDTKEIFASDFSKIKHSPFYKEYQEALKLANMIFKRFGFTLNSSSQNIKYKIPPFYIDMPELFERFVEVKLRKVYHDDLVAGYGQKNGNSYIWGLRPDFIVRNQKLIIDAKYKYWFENSDNDKIKNDYQQLSLYGRVTKIRNEIGISENEEAKLIFIYPKNDNYSDLNIDKINDVKDFNNIKKVAIGIPVIHQI
jgi:5-methylcytosine-specific restriction endonuclease McrBC regulatory subunit McrC